MQECLQIALTFISSPYCTRTEIDLRAINITVEVTIFIRKRKTNYRANFLKKTKVWWKIAIHSFDGETIHLKGYMGNSYGFKSYQQMKLLHVPN